MIKLRYDPSGNPETPTLVLSYRNGRHIGAFSDPQNFIFSDEFENPDQFSFLAYKEYCPFWEDITNFKLIWIPEWDRWYEITVELSENATTTKYITATHIAEAFLSQQMLYELEINTDDDINRKDYPDPKKHPQVFFNADYPESSLLHRITKNLTNVVLYCKGEHLAHEKNKLEFNFDGKSVLDALTEVSQTMNVHFEYDSRTAENGCYELLITAYDMLDYCEDCDERDDFGLIDPTCEVNANHKVTHGFGELTNVFFNIDNVLDDIKYTTDTGAVKNCFHLEAGDDDMTTAVQSLNPNYSRYIYYWSEDTKKNMSPELRDAVEEYSKLETEVLNTRKISGFSNSDQAKQYNDLVNKYNNLIENNSLSYDKLTSIPETISGYNNFAEVYWGTQETYGLLKSTLFPRANGLEATTAKEQWEKVRDYIVANPVSVKSSDNLTEANVDDSLKQMLNTVVDARYQVKLDTGEQSFDASTKKWLGHFTVIDSSATDDMIEQDKKDASGIYYYRDDNKVSVTVNTDYDVYLKNLIDVTLGKADKKNYDISELLKPSDDNKLKAALKLYCLDELENIRTVCDNMCIVLGEQTHNSDLSWEQLASELYGQYFTKQGYIQDEITLREKELKLVNDSFNAFTEKRKQLGDELNIRDFLEKKDPTLWIEFNSFIRQDTYSNSNYTQLDNDDNADVYRKARQFMKYARKDLKKSAEAQHTISVTAKNLFTIKEFEPMRNQMELGNWIRVMIDEKQYKLRLISYQYDFSNHTTMDITFSDVLEVRGSVHDVENVLNSAKQMATSFSYVERKAEKSSKTTEVVNNWFTEGMDATLINVNSMTGTQDQVWDENGILLRRQEPFTDAYDPMQIRLVNSSILFTNDNWKTLSTAFGKSFYKDEKGNLKEMYGINAETVVGKLLFGENLIITNDKGTMTFDNKGLVITNGNKTDPKTTFSVNPTNGNVYLSGEVNATSGKIGGWNIGENNIHSNPSNNQFVMLRNGASGGTGRETNGDVLIVRLGNGSTVPYTYPFWLRADGSMSCSNASITGEVTANSGKIGQFTIGTGIWSGKNAFTANTNGVYVGTDGISLGAVSNGHSAFEVNNAGQLYSSNANITGDVNATNLSAKDNLYLYTDANDKVKIMNIERVLSTDNLGIGSATKLNAIQVGSDTVMYTALEAKVHISLTAPKTFVTCLEGKVTSVEGGTAYPVRSSASEKYYTDTIQTTSSGLTVYGRYETSANTNKKFAASSSDRRLKENIKNTKVTNALEQILKIQHKEFNWKDSGKHIDVGYIAQELEQINELMVMKPVDDKDYYGVDTFYMMGLITKAIQELYEIVKGGE